MCAEGEVAATWTAAWAGITTGLFWGGVEVPRFSKIARSSLLHVGNLDWKQINPDISGSMIWAVAIVGEADPER